MGAEVLVLLALAYICGQSHKRVTEHEQNNATLNTYDSIEQGLANAVLANTFVNTIPAAIEKDRNILIFLFI